MKILITGGTGFIGSLLCRKLQGLGHQLVVLSRTPGKVNDRCGSTVAAIASLDEMDRQTSIGAIFNLAGEPIADSRWSEEKKRLLLESRIGITQQLIDYIERAEVKPRHLISGSAVGYYGDCGDRPLDEDSPSHDEFTHQLCQQWEQRALLAEQQGVKVSIVRTGLVVGRGGGFLQRMLPAFRLGLGGRMGSGRQWMSWVHIEDLTRLLIYLLENELAGIFNGTAPEPVTNAEFTRVLARCLNRPALLPMPAVMLKLAFGEMSRLLLTGQRVLPKRALDAGFEFRYRDLEAALREVLGQAEA